MSPGSPHSEAETGGLVDQDGPFLTRGESASGPEPCGRVDAPETGAPALRGNLRASLARVLDPVAYDARAVPQNLGQSWDQKTRRMVAEVHAEAAIDAGWRRVVEGDDTIERLAEVAHAVDSCCGQSLVEHQASMLNDFGETDPAYSEMARAVVRALREET